jgi:hypothetical protein
VLSAAGVEQMRAPQVTVWGDEAWGLSWALNKVGGVQTVGHGGGTLGQITLLTLVPERQFAVASFTNANRGGEINGAVTQWALKAYLGLESPDPEPLESTTAELDRFAGCYQAAMTEAELGVLAGRLIVQFIYRGGFPTTDSPPPPSPPPMWLERIEENRLMGMEGEAKGMKIDVIRTSDGKIGWLRSGGRLHRRVN